MHCVVSCVELCYVILPLQCALLRCSADYSDYFFCLSVSHSYGLALPLYLLLCAGEVLRRPRRVTEADGSTWKRGSSSRFTNAGAEGQEGEGGDDDDEEGDDGSGSASGADTGGRGKKARVPSSVLARPPRGSVGRCSAARVCLLTVCTLAQRRRVNPIYQTSFYHFVLSLVSISRFESDFLSVCLSVLCPSFCLSI